MLAVLMYHRVFNTGFTVKDNAFESHLQYLVENFPIMLPNDPIRKGLNICLSFDDAYYDFYHYVFPLLKTYKIKAQLAVPVKYVLDQTDIDPQTRLGVPHNVAIEDTYQSHAPLCTWKEIQEMVDSDHVVVASHSHTHKELTRPDVDLEEEIHLSKQLLEDKLGKPISTFVYPCGSMTREIHAQVMRHYQFAMRIGSALNKDWHSHRGMIHRINAEHFWPDNKAWEKFDTFRFWLKYLSNKIRHI